jgi:hypothetical protein
MQEGSRLLAQLHQQRLLADDNLDDKTLLDINTCTLLVKFAAIGIDLLDKARKSPDQCEQIHNGIHEYEKQIAG